MLSREVEYRNKEAVSYSLLSAFDTHVKYGRGDEKKYSNAFRFGSLVDCLLTSPEEFDNDYVVYGGQAPTGQMGAFCEALVKLYNINPLGDNAQQAYDMVGFKRDNLDKVLKRFETEGKEYCEAMIAAQDKTIITPDDNAKAVQLVNTVYTSPFTSYLFKELPEGVDRHFQYPVYWKYLGIDCKSLLDMIIVDHNNMAVYPVDFKTTSYPVENFDGSFEKFKYYLQAAFYTEALKYAFPEYEIKPFRFVVIHSELLDPPIVWLVGKDALHVGKYGGKLKSGRIVRGFHELIEEYKWHKKHDIWDVSRAVYEAGGYKVLTTK